jgi:heat shock protein HtpX
MYEQIARNKRQSLLLAGLVVLILVLLGYLIGEWAAPGAGRAGVVIAGAAGVLLGLIGYYSGSRAILALSGAKEIRKEDHPVLFNVVEEMSISAGLPMPRIFIIEDTAPNAFASGRDPKHATVAVTRGLLEKLNRDQLQGVIAHEMSHIRNYDVLFATLIAIEVGLIALICDSLRRHAFFTGGRRRSGRSKGGSGGGVLLIIVLVLAILAPLVSKLLQLAISRRREYLADASAVQLTRYPEGLASALEVISRDEEPLEAANRATQHLYIVNPMKKLGAAGKSLFSTHPPIEERIARIREMT